MFFNINILIIQLYARINIIIIQLILNVKSRSSIPFVKYFDPSLAIVIIFIV